MKEVEGVKVGRDGGILVIVKGWVVVKDWQVEVVVIRWIQKTLRGWTPYPYTYHTHIHTIHTFINSYHSSIHPYFAYEYSYIINRPFYTLPNSITHILYYNIPQITRTTPYYVLHTPNTSITLLCYTTPYLKLLIFDLILFTPILNLLYHTILYLTLLTPTVSMNSSNSDPTIYVW